MADKDNLNSISGWLAFFIFASLIISPIFQLFITFTEYTTILEIIEGLGMASLFVLIGVFLLKKKPYAVKFSKIVLITTLATNIILAFLGEIVFSPSYFISPLIWILYLYNSKRVKAVYGSLKETQKGLQAWPILGIIYAIVAPTFGIVFSIVGLINISKNRKLNGMALSIIALIIGIVIFLLSFGYYALLGANFDYVPEDIEISCNDYCYDVDGATSYLMEYDYQTESYLCYCTDDNSNTITQKSFPYSLE